jgi:Holliday junction resolvase-like predicted endonuclease
LSQQGFDIIDRNWKTKICEIDLIVQQDDTVFLVEVKYRSSQAQGGGFEYITSQKLKKMTFAAEVWKQSCRWEGDYKLMAAAVSGQNSENIEIIEID